MLVQEKKIMYNNISKNNTKTGNIKIKNKRTQHIIFKKTKQHIRTQPITK